MIIPNNLVKSERRCNVTSGADCLPNVSKAPDYQSMQVPQMGSRLETMTLNELLDTSFAPITPVIDNLLYAGTYILAGAPKVGKSFAVAQLAYHVSIGAPLWGNTVYQGTVLYIALEDGYPRLQRRLSQMFGVDGTDNLHFAVAANMLSNGLEEQIVRFIQEHPDTKLVIVDTLQKIRKAAKESYNYANDYEAIGALKNLADKHKICLLIVHHTRKQGAADRFDQISGTNGLLGCADGAMMLYKDERSDLTATLEIVGRDQPDQKILLKRDTARLCWMLERREVQVWNKVPHPQMEQIMTLIPQLVTDATPSWRGNASELRDVLGVEMQPNVLRRRLNEALGELWSKHGIALRNDRSSVKKAFELVKLNQDSNCDD